VQQQLLSSINSIKKNSALFLSLSSVAAMTDSTSRRSLRIDSLVGMSKIVKSPYEGGKCIKSAEVNERLFDEVKSLLAPKCGEMYRQMAASPAAQVRFGGKLARQIAEAYTQIEVSGMMYGSEWSQGIIREKYCGNIPKHIILLCLLERRFAVADKSNQGLFSVIVKDLNLCQDLVIAMNDWELTEKYPLVASCKSPSLFASNLRVQCLKCIIFVCRAWHASRLMKQKLDESLRTKIRECMQILNSSVRPPTSVQTQRPSINLGNGSCTSTNPPRIGVPPAASTSSHAQQGQLATTSSDDSPLMGSPMQRTESNGSSRSDYAGNMAQKQWYEDWVAHRTTLSAYEEKNYWYPMDPSELVLNPTEIELAWLLEETIYCTRKKKISWTFISELSSPTLKTQLKQLSKAGNESDSKDNAAEDERKLSKLVRMHYPLVQKRFAEVRLDVRKRLLLKEFRPAVRIIVPQLRRAMHPLRMKKWKVLREKEGSKV
jgi:hypothetical protein